MDDIIVMPKGWDIFCIGRDRNNHYWLQARHIASNKLFHDLGLPDVHAPTIREVAYAAAELITQYEEQIDD